MKNSKEFAQKVKKLYRSLKRGSLKPVKVEYDDPTDALVYSIISEKLDEKTSHAVLKRFINHFIDWNDLRVSLTDEIVEALGQNNTLGQEIASSLTTALNWIFIKYHSISLEPLHKMGKRPARETLEKIEGISRFSIDYCMLTSLQGHAIPLTNI